MTRSESPSVITYNIYHHHVLSSDILMSPVSAWFIYFCVFRCILSQNSVASSLLDNPRSEVETLWVTYYVSLLELSRSVTTVMFLYNLVPFDLPLFILLVLYNLCRNNELCCQYIYDSGVLKSLWVDVIWVSLRSVWNIFWYRVARIDSNSAFLVYILYYVLRIIKYFIIIKQTSSGGNFWHPVFISKQRDTIILQLGDHLCRTICSVCVYW